VDPDIGGLALGARGGARCRGARHPGSGRFEDARLPIDVRAIQTTDLDKWGDDPASAPFQDLLRSLGTVIKRQRASVKSAASSAPSAAAVPRVAICVLPFANMSGDQEQEYFSDGITEDIITDLSKVSALAVVSRNSGVYVQGQAC